MRSDRLDALARILVRYSTRVRPGDVCVIDAPAFCGDFIVAVSREILRAGGHPLARIELDGVTEQFMRGADAATLAWIDPAAEVVSEQADVRIVLDAEWNPRALATVAPETLAARSRVVGLSPSRAMVTARYQLVEKAAMSASSKGRTLHSEHRAARCVRQSFS